MKKIAIFIMILTSFQTMGVVPNWALTKVCQSDMDMSMDNCWNTLSNPDAHNLCEAYALPVVDFYKKIPERCDGIENSVRLLEQKIYKISSERALLVSLKDYHNLCRARQMVYSREYYKAAKHCDQMSDYNGKTFCTAISLKRGLDLKIVKHYPLQANDEYRPEHLDLPRQKCMTIVDDIQLRGICLGMTDSHKMHSSSSEMLTIIGDAVYPDSRQERENPFLKDVEESKKRLFEVVRKETRRANCGIM